MQNTKMGMGYQLQEVIHHKPFRVKLNYFTDHLNVSETGWFHMEWPYSKFNKDSKSEIKI